MKLRKLLNTLYICTTDLYLSLKNENVLVTKDKEEINHFPLHTLESIVTFSYKGISVPLISACSQKGIPIFLLSGSGNLIAEISLPSKGNIMLRKEQYRIADQPDKATRLAASFLSGKIKNQKHLIDRHTWEYPHSHGFEHIHDSLSSIAEKVRHSTNLHTLRGLEGEAAATYFSCFDSFIMDESPDFRFHGRSQRPPLDRVNALLSFGYTMLHNECVSALECVGLDASAGFLHEDHPGRKSLACDLIEELRSPIVDRFVISLINRKIINSKQFDLKDDGSVYLSSEGRKIFLHHWQLYKKQEITHHDLNETIPLGLIPFVQASHLAKVIRGEEKTYRPFRRR